MIITSQGISRNVIRLVHQIGQDGKYHWVNTDEFNPENYDLSAEIKSMPEEKRQEFWSKNYAEINLTVADLTAGSDGIAKILSHIEQLGRKFTENKQMLINIDLSAPVTARPSGTFVLVVPTIASLVPLAKELDTFKSMKSCVVTLHTPADIYLDWQWLDHAVPFKCLSCLLEFKWKPEGMPQQRVRGEHLHHINLEWAKVRKELRGAVAYRHGEQH